MWEEIGKAVGARGECPPAREAHHLTVLTQEDYLTLVMEVVGEYINTVSAVLGEPWAGYVSYDRHVDVESVTLPGLLEHLREFATKGDMKDLLAAHSLVLNLLTRELLRQGKLPVMYPVGKVPSTPVTDEFPLIGSFSEFIPG